MGKSRRCRNRPLAGLLVLFAVGCGGPVYHPVAGTVRLDGHPLAEASVLLEPVAGGPAAHGVTDASGRFDLQSANRPGVVAGEYRVVVTKQQVTGVRADETQEAGGAKVKWIVPERYSKPATSGLTATVPSPAYDLDVTSKP